MPDSVSLLMMRLRPAAAFIAAFLCTSVAPASVVITHPYEGITRLERTETTPRKVKMQIVQIDLAAPGLRFKLTSPGGTRDTIRQTTLDFLEQEHAQVAINAHFFVPYPSSDNEANLVGLAASEGTVFSPFEPQPVWPGYADQSYAILPFAPALNINSNSHALIVHHDPAYPDNRHVREAVALWNVVAGSAQIVSNGVKTVPVYSGPPGGLNPTNGYSDSKSWYALLRARTAIGLTAENRMLVLFTVDEAGGSGGMSVVEVADRLIDDYHVQNALNLDGGGSTTLALQDPLTHASRVVNAPSGGQSGRPVGSSLAVFAPPSPGLAALLTTAMTDTNTVVFSWPAQSKRCQLQQNPGLNTADWKDLGAAAQQSGDTLQIIVIPQGSARFYRLAEPR
jgi:hypothetical protein